eukprot:m.5466 g.5466  ORF g.5466 m.5466 type:complete len:64 (-) comp7693_c0_seq1:31-222(-)
MPMEETYEVERFVGKKKIGGLVHYRVKWKGEPMSQASWHKRTELIKDLGKEFVEELAKTISKS